MNHQWVNKVAVRPIDLQPGMAAAIKVIAVVGSDNDWAAYIGPSDWPDELIATYGAKIDREAAELLFPVFRVGRAYRD